MADGNGTDGEAVEGFDLFGWKEIRSACGRPSRKTLWRWTRELGFPAHELPNGRMAARRAEVYEWLRSGPSEER